MAIFFATAFPDRDGISERFAPEAKGMLALVNPADGNNQDSTTAMAEKVGNADHFNLNPPDDSPSAKLEKIMSLIRKGEPIKALERASTLLNGPEMDGELKLKLRGVVEVGLHDLTIAGRSNDANYFRLQLAPALELSPQLKPQPAPQFGMRTPGPTYGMVA